MSVRVDSSPLITGAVVVGVPGLGVLAEAIGLTDPEIWSPGMLARHYGVEK